jgi:nucleoside-diphosphate-sugar epimerase
VKILVTGGAGFLGGALVRRLAGDGHEVRVLDDFSRGHRGRLDGVPCEVTEGDVRDPDAVTAAMAGCRSVAHLAYVNGTASFYTAPAQVLDVALRGIVNVLDACRETGCRDLLLVSSPEVYADPPAVPSPETVPLTVPDVRNPRFSYGGGKIACELAAVAWQQAGVLDRAVIVRPCNVYGEGDGTDGHVIPDFCRRMSALAAQQPEGVIPFQIQGSGRETRSFTWIGDCTGQLVFLLARAPQGAHVFHAGSADERTITNVAHEVAACYGRTIRVIPGPLAGGSPLRRVPDLAKITELGWPGVAMPFAEGLRRTVAWHRAQEAALAGRGVP